MPRTKRMLPSMGRDYMTSSDALDMVIAKGISCTRATLHRWFEKIPEIAIQPGGPGGYYHVHIKNFRKFLQEKGAK